MAREYSRSHTGKPQRSPAMFQRFTDRSRKVYAIAESEAKRLSHPSLDTEHVLFGLISEGTGVGFHVLKTLGIDTARIAAQIGRFAPPGRHPSPPGKLPLAPGAKKVVQYAIAEARDLGHTYVGTEHLLLGLIREQRGMAARILSDSPVPLDQARAQVRTLLDAGMKAQPSPPPAVAQRERSWDVPAAVPPRARDPWKAAFFILAGLVVLAVLAFFAAR